MRIQVTIEGVTPLLMARFEAEAELELSSGHRPAFNHDSDTPRGKAERKLYVDTDGNLFVPGPCIMACLISAGRFHKIGRNKVTTRDTSLVTAGIELEELACQLNTNEWEVDTRSIVNPVTKGRQMCHRPRIDEWSLIFTLNIDTTMFPPKLIRQLVDDAGRKCGLLSYRPEKKGPFGKFNVKKWEVLEQNLEEVTIEPDDILDSIGRSNAERSNVG